MQAATEADARLLEWQLVVPASTDVVVQPKASRTGAVVDRDDHDFLAHDTWGIAVRITQA